MQKAYKAVAASQYFRPIERSIVPSMEIRVHSRVKSKLGTKVALMQGAYYQEAMGMKSLNIQTHSRCKRSTKLYGPANIYVPCSVESCRTK